MTRRGIALLAALWLVVAIATVSLALAIEVAEHRRIGFTASDGDAARIAADGALAIAQARLEQAYRQVPRNTGSNASRLRASDPWLDADSLLPDTLQLGNVRVLMRAEDLESKLNINRAGSGELRAFFNALLRDYNMADQLVQAITDWRDRDELQQPRGAERDEYLQHRRLDLPTNRDFRNIDELRSVEGMTPEVFTLIRPYLRTQGNPRINVNTAPLPVLRAIPGMTDGIAARILAIRSQHQRISSQRELGLTSQAVSFTTTKLVLTVIAVPPMPAHPVRVEPIILWTGSNAAVIWF